MRYTIRCTDKQGDMPIYSAPFPSLEEAKENLVRWKRREGWQELQIWATDPDAIKKPCCVYTERRNSG